MAVNPDWKAPAGEAFPVVSEGLYQVFIEDAEIKETADYNDPSKMVEVIKFTFHILEGEFKGQKLWKNAKPYFSDKPGQKKSTLTEIFEATFKASPVQVGVKELSGAIINKFIGRQLQVMVKTTMSGKGNEYSKIPEGGFLRAKVELTLPEGFQRPPEAKQEALPTVNLDEEDKPAIDLKDIPF